MRSPCVRGGWSLVSGFPIVRTLTIVGWKLGAGNDASEAAGWELIDEHRAVGPASTTQDFFRVPCHRPASAIPREAPEGDAVCVGDARRLARLRRRRGGAGWSGSGASAFSARAGVAHAAGSGGPGWAPSGRGPLLTSPSRA